MATVTSLTAARMIAIENASIVDGNIVGDDLILTNYGGQNINAGSVRGAQGIQGPVGPTGPANPSGTFIIGGWTVDPEGFLILDGRRIIGGATSQAVLAGMFPSWVDGADLVLPLADQLVPMVVPGSPPGVISGSMTHNLTNVNQLPVHSHAGPDHKHTIAHGHGNNFAVSHNISASTGWSSEDLVRRLASGQDGFWTGVNSDYSLGSQHLDLSPGSPDISWVTAGMAVDYSGLHNHTVTIGGGVSISGGVTSVTTATTSGWSGTSPATGPVGSSAPIDHTPKHITVRMAVKT